MRAVSERVLRNRESHSALRELLEATPVSTLMTTPVRCAKETMTSAQVGRIMLDAGLSAMPIVDHKGVVIGLVTKTDLVREEYGEARNPGAAGQVLKFMTPFVLRLNVDDSLNNAVSMMAKAGVHHVVVTDAIGHAQGMLSSLDLVRWIAAMSETAELEAELASAR